MRASARAVRPAPWEDPSCRIARLDAQVVKRLRAVLPALFLLAAAFLVFVTLWRTPPPVRSDDEFRIEPKQGDQLGAWMNASAAGYRFDGGEIKHTFGVFWYAGPAGRVTVSARREGRSVVVRVIDDGPGIPPEIRARIFDPFFTTKEPGRGTGMGLEIARRLVRGHGGDIEFDSSPGRTEFRVSLPVAEEAPREGLAAGAGA